MKEQTAMTPKEFIYQSELVELGNEWCYGDDVFKLMEDYANEKLKNYLPKDKVKELH